jgi:hypothetical protein
MQHRSRSVKAALFDHRRECGELLSVHLHISDPNARQQSLAVLMTPGSLTSKP